MTTLNATDVWIPKEACIKGRLYILRSRNLPMGVYNGEGGFIGVREKFGTFFLFTEYHWDNGPPFGTVKPVSDTDVDLPAYIELRESFAEKQHDMKTGRPVDFDKTPATPEEGGNSAGFKGWFYKDTGEYSTAIRPALPANKKLHDWLAEQEINLHSAKGERFKDNG